MYAARIVVQQSGQSSQHATTTERPERPEQPERPERPEAGTRHGTQSAQELRDQIKQTIMAAQDAARDAQNQARDARNQARDAGAPAFAQFGTHTVQPNDFPNNVIPPQVVDISIGFFVMCAVMVIGWPLARAFGRRLERGVASPAAIPAAMGEQLQRIEQAVEAMSIEIERISESQRFLTKLQSSNNAEHPALPASDRR